MMGLKIPLVYPPKAEPAKVLHITHTMADSRNLTPVILLNSGENDMSTGILKELNAGAPAEYLKMLEDSASTNAPIKTPDAADEKKK